MPRRSWVSSSERTLWPSIVISPSEIEIRRFTIFSAVVLPHPDGPISTQISPGGISKLSRSTACRERPGYRLVVSRNAISAQPDSVREFPPEALVIDDICDCSSSLIRLRGVPDASEDTIHSSFLREGTHHVAPAAI